MIELVVVMHLTFWDADAGVQLGNEYTKEYRHMPDAFIKRNLIEDCRLDGLRLANEGVTRWRGKGHKPNAFANVDCQWEPAKESI